jgi:hypothetical protein
MPIRESNYGDPIAASTPVAVMVIGCGCWQVIFRKKKIVFSVRPILG